MTVTVTAAGLALAALLQILDDAEIVATREASGFSPDPIGVLIGLPSRVGSTLGGATFEIPVLVVSGDPVNTGEAVDRLYAEADAIAAVLQEVSYRPTSWAGSSRTQPLAAVEITATVTVSNSEEV